MIPFPESIMDRDEPFAGLDCRPGWPMSTRAFERLAASHGYRLLWRQWNAPESMWSDGATVHVDHASATRPAGSVLEAEFVARDTLLVSVFRPGQKDAPPDSWVHGGHPGTCPKGPSPSP
jgi:hypothetical protein